MDATTESGHQDPQEAHNPGRSEHLQLSSRPIGLHTADAALKAAVEAGTADALQAAIRAAVTHMAAASSTEADLSQV